MSEKIPKVFLSYSWSSQEHKIRVRNWADRLLNDGIEVVFDEYDLQEGHDIFAFMEKMVNDESVTHVLVFSDKSYSGKADSRKAGVGTESQIISKKIYEQTEQSKFIPIVCEFDEEGNPYLPTFLRSRKYINFSSHELVNKNWKGLIRTLYGQPTHRKPDRGEPPPYITDDSSSQPTSAGLIFQELEHAVMEGKPAVAKFRSEFLDACIDYADSLRVRVPPESAMTVDGIIDDCGKLRPIRNLIVDWVLLETSSTSKEQLENVLIEFLERLRELKLPIRELDWHQNAWFSAHIVFVYETFLYIIAALLKTNSFEILHEIFKTNYFSPEAGRHGGQEYDTFRCFWGSSEFLKQNLTSQYRSELYSPEAELINRQADRSDIPFESIADAEGLVVFMAILRNIYWYPGTLSYVIYSHKFSFIVRAKQHKGFKNLAIITGIDTADQLRSKFHLAMNDRNNNRWPNYMFRDDFRSRFRLDELDTLT